MRFLAAEAGACSASKRAREAKSPTGMLRVCFHPPESFMLVLLVVALVLWSDPQGPCVDRCCVWQLLR